MFPTAGYFRSTNCPFFVHGLCHRPYCHFRHSKPGLKVSKSKISPHKHKTDGRHTGTNTAEAIVTVEEHSEHANKITGPDNKMGKTHVHFDCNEGKHEINSTTAVRGILKRPQQDAVKESNPEVSLAAESVDQTTTVSNSATTDRNSTETFDSDDTDQPFASLTDEEKQIIGLLSHPPSVSSNLGTGKSSDAKTAPLSNAIDVSSINSDTLSSISSDTSAEASKLGKEGVVTCEQDDVNKTDAYKEAQVILAKKSSSDKAVNSSDVKEKVEDELPRDSGGNSTAQTEDIAGANSNEKSDTSSRKRKSVQLKTSTSTTKTAFEGIKDETPKLDVTSKKRKSQQLPCVKDHCSPESKSAEEVNQVKHSKANESCIKQETKLHQILKSSSKLFEGIDCSKKILSSSKDSVAQDMAHSPKKEKPVSDSPTTLKRKTPVKESPIENTHVPKKKINVCEAEINFFSPAKKVSKSSKVEKGKKPISKEKTPLVKNTKVTRLGTKGLEKSKDSKQKFSKGVTILISDESDSFSAATCESSSEEDSHLKQIWDDFEPQNDNIVMVEDSQSPVKTLAPNLSRKKMSPVAAVATDIDKQPSLVNTLGLGKKQRVAHAASHLPRRLSSNANPVRRYPKTLAAVQKKDEPAAASASMESSVAAATSYKPAKQRVAHVLKRSAPSGSLPRPRIPVEYGAKVPQNQRQRYLDRIIDEYLRLCSTEKEAFEKAIEEEQALYERSTRRQVYLNLCVNAIKKLRDMTPQEMPASSPVKTETTTRVAVTKTLPSGAVVISTKSPVKQDQPVTPASDNLSEDVMYDFLSKYLMTEEDLVENGYPRPCPTSPGKALFKTKKEQPSKDSTRRICRRCGKPFVVLEDGVYLTREECVYHAGKLFRKRGEQITNYSCCQGDAGSPGCCVGKVHVSDDTCNTDGFMTTIVSPLADQRKKIFAMDCEMCYTTAGLELTRITVVNWNLEGVYDTFVMPERTIVDYNTRFSGVTQESLRGVTTTLREVQAVLLSMIHRDTILVGHSLESDLKATKLIHSKVVDTSVVFPHRLGPPYKRALRNLMADHLKKIIQDSVDGHDSHEDARACLELMRWKVKEDMKRTSRHKSPRLSLG